MNFLFLALLACLSPYLLSALSTELPTSPSKEQFTFLDGTYTTRSQNVYNGSDVSQVSVKEAYSSQEQRSSVFFAADNTAALYINGVLQYKVSRWRDFAFKNVHLKYGDVVSIVAVDYGGWWGAIAAINFSWKRFPTGGPGWKAIKGRGPKGWMLPSFSACYWPDAVVRPGARKIIPGKAPYFPYSVDARYVWAEGAGVTDTISMRYTIGEKCLSSSKITFAADNSASLYVNGKLIQSINNWQLFTTVTLDLKIGDVVSIIATDYGGWWGAIAAIEYWGRSFVTGRDDFKAVKGFAIKGDNSKAWMLPEYSSCGWSNAELRPKPGVIHPGKATHFPYSTGARYVWARGAGKSDQVYIRFVVGGELC